jgi:integrase/recombinase XerD
MNDLLTTTDPSPRALVPPMDTDALLAAWLAALELRVRAGELSETTRKTYLRGAQKFLSFTPSPHAHAADAVLEWIASERAKGRSPAAINTWLAGARAFFDWTVATQRAPFNPTQGIRGAKRTGTTRQHKRDELTDTEVKRVLAAPNTATPEGVRDRALMALMAYTAARSIELHRADLEHLRTEGGKLVLRVQGKGRIAADQVLVIAHPEAEAALRDWLALRGETPGALFVSLSNATRGERLSLRALRGIVKTYYGMAGVRGESKTTHSLRHSAITNAIRHGAPIQKVRAMARHASIETTMIYYHELDRIENPAESFIRYDAEGK